MVSERSSWQATIKAVNPPQPILIRKHNCLMILRFLGVRMRRQRSLMLMSIAHLQSVSMEPVTKTFRLPIGRAMTGWQGTRKRGPGRMMISPQFRERPNRGAGCHLRIRIVRANKIRFLRLTSRCLLLKSHSIFLQFKGMKNLQSHP